MEPKQKYWDNSIRPGRPINMFRSSFFRIFQFQISLRVIRQQRANSQHPPPRTKQPTHAEQQNINFPPISSNQPTPKTKKWKKIKHFGLKLNGRGWQKKNPGNQPTPGSQPTPGTQPTPSLQDWATNQHILPQVFLVFLNFRFLSEQHTNTGQPTNTGQQTNTFPPQPGSQPTP